MAATRPRPELAGFGQALGDALAMRGMNQAELAQALNTTQSMVSVWRNGIYECPHPTIYRIEAILDLEPGTLSRHLGCWPAKTVDASFDEALERSGLTDANQATIRTLFETLLKQQTAAGGSGRRRVKAR